MSGNEVSNRVETKEVEQVQIEFTTKPTIINRLVARLIGMKWVKVKVQVPAAL